MYLALTRLEEIENRLRFANSNMFNFQKIKKEMLNFYKDNSAKLELLTEDQFNAHSFVKEITFKCEAAEKESIKPALIDCLIGLERHKYAPELNTLLFVSGEQYRAPQATDTKQALNQLINSHSVTTLKAIIRTNS